MSAQSPAQTPPPTESLSTPVHRRSRTIGTGLAITIAVVLLIVGIGAGYVIGNSLKSSSSTSTTVLTETGSSLLYPLMKIWGPNYTAYNPSVTLSPVASGSGAGQSNAELGLVNIGASDGYLANASVTSLINLPVAISAQLVYYNLPGVTGHLNLNGTVLAMMYGGAITTWESPMILAAQNATIQGELKALPTSDQTITLIKRADSSGDTFLFTSLCYMSWAGFPYSASTSGLSGLTGSNVLPETGNSEMVTGVEGTPGGIAYIGISYAHTVTGANVNFAAVGDNSSLSASGGLNSANYVLPNPTTISQDANLGLARLNFASYQLAVTLILGGSWAGAITLIHGGGGSNPTMASPTPYPLVNLEYTLIKTAPVSGSKTVTSSALHDTVLFLQWAIAYGNLPQYLNQVGFVPLTPAVAGYDATELSSVAA